MPAPMFAPPGAVMVDRLIARPGDAVAIYDIRDDRRLSEGFLVSKADLIVIRSGGKPPLHEVSYDPRHVMVLALERPAPDATEAPTPTPIWNRFMAAADPIEPVVKYPEIRGIV